MATDDGTDDGTDDEAADEAAELEAEIESWESEVWDPDDSWVAEVDDHFTLAFPFGLGLLVSRRLKHGSRDVFRAHDVVVDAEVAGSIRPLERSEIAALVDRASTIGREAIGVRLDLVDLQLVASAFTMLAEIWSVALDGTPSRARWRAGDERWLAILRKLADDCEHTAFAPIRRRSDGVYALQWSEEDVALVEGMTARLRGLLSSDDPSISRLFPSAYGADADRNAGWDVLMRGELIERRLASIAIVDDLLHRTEATDDEVQAFMRAVNDARLVLGTQLDVDESMRPLDITVDQLEDYRAFERLGHLLHMTIRALRGSL